MASGFVAVFGPSVLAATSSMKIGSSNSRREVDMSVGKAVRGGGGCLCYGGGVEKRKRRSQNVDGDLFVDTACIDCDTCRWMAPSVFSRVDGMAAVSKQPESKEDQHRSLALRAQSIPRNLLNISHKLTIHFLLLLTVKISETLQNFKGVYHCGHHSKYSYGAASYFIVDPEGNILVDSPRYSEKLAWSLEMLGGASYMFLTHKDDVADHEKWAKRFSCTRILHAGDIELGTDNVEMKLEGSGPWSINHDIDLIYTRGHSEGSVCLFYKSLNVLFFGDHLAMTVSGLDIQSDTITIQFPYNWRMLSYSYAWISCGYCLVMVEESTSKTSMIKTRQSSLTWQIEAIYLCQKTSLSQHM